MMIQGVHLDLSFGDVVQFVFLTDTTRVILLSETLITTASSYFHVECFMDAPKASTIQTELILGIIWADKFIGIVVV